MDSKDEDILDKSKMYDDVGKKGDSNNRIHRRRQNVKYIQTFHGFITILEYYKIFFWRMP